MTAKEFFDLVAEMRTAQKCYFKFRTMNYLNQSKKLEKQVDDEIRRVERIVSGTDLQTDLFQEER